MSFTFGITAVGMGIPPLAAILISMTNLTSAGQVQGIRIIAAAGGYIEMALAQLIINLRYALMSVSLSQKLGKSVRMIDRFIIAFVNTDEVFAVASGKENNVERNYLYGLIIPPFAGWSLGTFIGAVAGNVLPEIVISSLGIAIYGMFVAIVVPVAKKNKSTALCVLFAIILSCCFKYIPLLSAVPGGFVIIICAVVASSVFAVISPLNVAKEKDYE